MTDRTTPDIPPAVAQFVNAVEFEAALLRYSRRLPESQLVGVYISARFRERIEEEKIPIDRWMDVRGLRLHTIDTPEALITTVIDGKAIDRVFIIVVMGASA